MATSSTLPRNCVASSINPKAPWQLVGWSKLVLLTSLRKILSDALFPSGSPFGDFDPHDGDRDFFGKTGIVSDTRKQLYSVCWLGCWRPCCGFHQVTPGVFIDNIDNTLLWHLFRDSITLLIPHILIRLCSCRGRKAFPASGKTPCNTSAVQMEFCQIAFHPPLKQTNALWELFSPMICKFVKISSFDFGIFWQWLWSNFVL